MSGKEEIPLPSARRKRWDEPVMTGRDDARATWRDGHDGTGWRKSSRSGERGECCEASLDASAGVLLRDSLHPDGNVLWFRSREWLSLLSSLS
ncbi:DUF397 domain-containing protein [Nocardiopsis quinghaiensis]|uniref:DUF397 domain-containing protein n=1 Tax=Nocardiopsis quinghaiensis TaxID=464995 RepID=UPI002958A4F3|nr:DUF397 domain-containing protein [Nocardiopsis quinghaiensis]